MPFTRFLHVALLVAMAAPAGAQNQTAIGQGSLPPIERSYRDRIVAWSRTFYADPRSIRSATISDPVMIRDDRGRLLWLVCVDAAGGGAGARAEPVRHAFGFAPDFFSAPQQRNGSTLVRSDCDERPLTFRPFPALGRP